MDMGLAPRDRAATCPSTILCYLTFLKSIGFIGFTHYLI